MLLHTNVLLAPYTTFQTGGLADYFCRVTSLDELREAIRKGKEKKLPVFILGGGSNILVHDDGVRGLVVKLDLVGTEINQKAAGKASVTASAGESWDRLVASTVERGLYGLENLSGIPGTVGATPIQNIGAYGVEVGDVIEWVEVFDTETMRCMTLGNEECLFSYRNSIFKTDGGKKFVITKVCYRLTHDGMLNTSYGDVTRFLHAHNISSPTLADMRRAILSIRESKFPDIRKIGTAGSFFKNPVLPKAKADQLIKRFPDIPRFSLKDGRIKVPIAWILDHALAWKGVRRSHVGVYKDHSLVIMHFGGGTTQEIQTFAKEIQQDVKENIGIDIESEVTFVGF